MPTLCIPRRKSILIETIHHSRGPTDELLFLRSRRRAARTFILGPLQLQTRADRFGASTSSSLCRPGFHWDSILPDFAEFRSNGRFWFISSPALRLPAFFFFRRPVELCAAGFASFRGIPAGPGHGARTFRPMT